VPGVVGRRVVILMTTNGIVRPIDRPTQSIGISARVAADSWVVSCTRVSGTAVGVYVLGVPAHPEPLLFGIWSKK
jgi:hypothetical protein